MIYCVLNSNSEYARLKKLFSRKICRTQYIDWGLYDMLSKWELWYKKKLYTRAINAFIN